MRAAPLVQIAPANADRAHAQQNIALADLRDGHFAQFHGKRLA
jgi:hypothetical protein